MALFTLTVNNQSPGLEHKVAEAALVAQALGIAAQNLQGGGGLQSSGTIVGNGGVTLGSWTFTSQNASPS